MKKNILKSIIQVVEKRHGCDFSKLEDIRIEEHTASYMLSTDNITKDLLIFIKIDGKKTLLGKLNSVTGVLDVYTPSPFVKKVIDKMWDETEVIPSSFKWEGRCDTGWYNITTKGRFRRSDIESSNIYNFKYEQPYNCCKDKNVLRETLSERCIINLHN